MEKHIIKLATRFLTNTERGFVSVDVEADCPLAEYSKHPRLRWLKDGTSCPSLNGAREISDTAARTIRFMDAASVRPSGAWVSLFRHDDGMGCGVGSSGFDHTQVWNWIGRSRLVTTEPYERGVMDALNWCFEHGWEARQLPEWGMWNPPKTTLILCVPPKNGASLEAILRQMRAQTPIPLADRQKGGTVTRQPRFTSGRGAA